MLGPCCCLLFAVLPGDYETLLPVDTASGDRLGTGVDVEGDVAIVGAERADDGASGAGAAYVFRRVAGVWVEEQELLPPDPNSNDHFGRAVAVGGDLAVVGMPDDDDVLDSAGSIYIWRHDGASWVFEQKFPNPDPVVNARFGWAVATNGVEIAVGSKSDDGIVDDSGAVYVLDKPGLLWAQDAKLKASDAAEDDQLGDAVDFDGDAIVAGAWQSGTSFPGAAYVFRDGPGGWTEEQKLTASDAQTFDWFGRSVSIDGDRIAVGVYRADVGAADGPGAVYVFDNEPGGWDEKAKLVPSDWVGDESNGWSCAVSGDTVVVGSRRNGENGSSSGAVVLFRRNAGVWTEEVKLAAPQGAGGDELASSIAFDGTHLLAGAPLADPVGSSSGLVHAWEDPGEGSLAAAPETISVTTGGTQDFYLGAGLAHAGAIHLMVGSISGTSPGILVDGVHVPLNPDAYTTITLTTPGAISGGVGVLGPAGQGHASIAIGAGSSALAGLTVQHAYVVLDGSLNVVLASNAASLTLVP